MNPLTNIRSRQRQRENEVINGIPNSASYHTDYRNSAYIYAGQLSFNLTEGDLLAIFSEYGEVVDVNLVRYVPFYARMDCTHASCAGVRCVKPKNR